MRIERRRFLTGGFCALCAGPGLLACTPTDGRPQTGIDANADLGARRTPEQPDPTPLDEGFRAVLDREEGRIRNSRARVRDPKLVSYIEARVAEVAGPYARDIRPYVMRAPNFNASQFPNGMMHIQTGLLVRCRNEAQMMAVLGHEFGLYVRRHGIERHENARGAANFFMALQMLLGAAGINGTAASVAQMLDLQGFAFSRDHEREADEIGIRKMAELGLSPEEAAKTWESLVAELGAIGVRGDRYNPLSTHPATSERIATLRARARDLGTGLTRRERYLAAIADIRPSLFDEELRTGNYAGTISICDGWIGDDPRDALAHFTRGEAFRLRNRDDDARHARQALDWAAGLHGAPPATFRALGQLHRREGRASEADRNFKRYLELAPVAPDRQAIRAMISS